MADIPLPSTEPINTHGSTENYNEAENTGYLSACCYFCILHWEKEANLFASTSFFTYFSDRRN